jgi:hypothetical protein
MSIVPATYFSDHIRRAQCEIGNATDSISLAAVAQLQAAYDLLAADAETLRNGPAFQIASSNQAPFGYALAIDFSLAQEKPGEGFGTSATAPVPPGDHRAVLLDTRR